MKVAQDRRAYPTPNSTGRLPAAGRIAPQISDAEIITLSVMQALLGHSSQARWLRHATAHLKHLFPYLPQQPGYNKRLRKLAGTVNWLIGMLGRDTSVWTDDVWVVDSTPVECGRSRETTRRSDLAGWAVWLLRRPFPLLLGTAAAPGRHPAGPADRLRAHRREGRRTSSPTRLLNDNPTLAGSRPGQILIGDKNYYGRDFQADLADQGIQLLRRARKGEPERPGGRFFKPLRQTVESIYDTLKGQLDLEQHGGRTTAGVFVRVAQRLLALTAAIWHNDHTGQLVKRSLLTYDH